MPVEFVARNFSESSIESTSEFYPVTRGQLCIGLVIASDDDVDSQHIKETLQTMNYCVHVIPDLNSLKLSEIITNEASCFICYLSLSTTAAESNQIDGLIDDVCKCQSLHGKPKLFFIQSNTASTYPIPVPNSPLNHDVFVACATNPEHASFPSVLSELLLDNAKSCDFSLLMEKLSVIVNMFLPHKECWEAKSTLNKKLLLIPQDELLNYDLMLSSALAERYITTRWTKLTVAGPPGCGRSSVINLLAKGTASQGQKGVDVFIAKKNSNDPWERANYSSLKNMVAVTVKKRQISRQTSIIFSKARTLRAEKKQIQFQHRPRSFSTVARDIKEVLHADNKSNAIRHADNKSNAISTKHLIYVIDSEGEANFLNLPPVLQRHNSVNIFIHKLTEKLVDKSPFCYRIGQKVFFEPDDLRKSNIQLVEASLRSLESVRSPPVSDIASNFLSIKQPMKCPPYSLLVLGTFHDEIHSEESLDIKNSNLIERVGSQHRSKVIDYRNGQKIFPLNAATEQESEIKRLRSKVCRHYVEADVPVKWMLLQLDLLEKSENNNKMFISLSDCKKMGADLQMNDEEVKAALKFFHDLTIFLYFADALPDIVFLHPKPILRKLSELISISIPDAYDYMEDDEGIDFNQDAHYNLKFRGTLTESLLYDLDPLSPFVPPFTAEKFMKLLEYLFIVVKLPKSDKYFLPSVLPTATESDLKTIRDEFTMPNRQNQQEIEPFVFKWENYVPQGLFPGLVIQLLNETFNLTDDHSKPNEPRYCNAMQLTSYDIGGSILLIDSVNWLELYYSGPSKTCPIIRHKVEQAIDAVMKKLNDAPIGSSESNGSLSSKPEHFFICTCTLTCCDQAERHLCKPDAANEYVHCCLPKTSYWGCIMLNQLKWLCTKEQLREGFQKEILQKTPQITDLMKLLTDVAPDYQEIGTNLRVNMYKLGLKYESRSLQDNLTITLQEWLNNGNNHNDKEHYYPVTWSNIIEAIESRSFKKAEQIRAFLIQPNNYQRYTTPS